MRLISYAYVVVAFALDVAAAENAKFCTQDEKELANSLHEQNTNPAKSCYRAANGDITTLATSRLCPLSECVTWLDYMAANAPDCYFDSKNYATIYATKSAECTGGEGSGSANLRSSSSGSESSSSLTNGTTLNIDDSSSPSAMSEGRDLNTTASTAGDVSDVGESSSMDSASGGAETDETNAPTPTPIEDQTIESQSTSAATDSSNSSTPAPTTSASSSLSMISSFIALNSVVASIVIELM
ncbi:hypothetical protein P3T76_000312 [Phytophthora citrophthora]|uniref:Elicitin n=1 Tax=Phytophthora citrophthora TaxID=4793 RepID=A0AAD9LV65_9STRA|nr:hypothetical protein P3T76_000312 [Phytophthora citrophthora]